MLPALVAVVHPLVSKMDFQFTHYQGNVSVKCSMELIALANWFNTEVRSNSDKILTALSTAQSPSENQEKILIGAEYTLFLNADEVMVRANNLAIESDEILEQDFHYYDEESLAFCGTQDFIHFLRSYVDFIA